MTNLPILPALQRVGQLLTMIADDREFCLTCGKDCEGSGKGSMPICNPTNKCTRSPGNHSGRANEALQLLGIDTSHTLIEAAIEPEPVCLLGSKPVEWIRWVADYGTETEILCDNCAKQEESFNAETNLVDRLTEQANSYEAAVNAGHVAAIVPANLTDEQYQLIIERGSPAGYNCELLHKSDDLRFMYLLSDYNIKKDSSN